MSPSSFVQASLDRLEAEAQRSGRTPLVPLPLPEFSSTPIYLKDESRQITASLKHRLGRALFAQALKQGWLSAGQWVVEASSGNTAVSEAYYAQLLGLPFVAVMPKSTSQAKQQAVKAYGGKVHLVEKSHQIYAAAEELAHSLGGHYMDQFSQASAA